MKAILVLCLCALTGCVTPTPPTVLIREVPSQPTSTSRLDIVRFPATYKSYTVGRRVDPNNPGVMQESHVFYVRESQDRWNLNPAPVGADLAPLSPAPADPAFTPLPLSEQLRQELVQQRQVSQSLNDQIQRMKVVADTFVPAAQRTVELTRELNRRQQALDDRLHRLEQSGPVLLPTNAPVLPSTNR